MTKTEYKQVKDSVKDWISNCKGNDLTAEYSDLKSLYVDYYQWVQVWKIWIDEIISFNENYELCFQIMKIIEYNRNENIKLAKKLNIYDNELEENLLFIEFKAFNKKEKNNNESVN